MFSSFLQEEGISIFNPLILYSVDSVSIIVDDCETVLSVEFKTEESFSPLPHPAKTAAHNSVANTKLIIFFILSPPCINIPYFIILREI